MNTSQILWIDLQPSLYCLFKRTAQALGQNFEVKRWSFEHDLDESCDVEVVHSLMRQHNRKLFKSGSSYRPRNKRDNCIFICSKISQKHIISISVISRYSFNESMDKSLSEHAKPITLLKISYIKPSEPTAGR